MAYKIQINEYQRKLINRALRTALVAEAEQLAIEPGLDYATAYLELSSLIAMTEEGELTPGDCLNGLCL